MRTRLAMLEEGPAVRIGAELLQPPGWEPEAELELRVESGRLVVERAELRRRRVEQASRRIMDEHDAAFRRLAR